MRWAGTMEQRIADAPGGRRTAERLGLYGHSHGNAWEWVEDLYHRDCADAPHRRLGLAGHDRRRHRSSGITRRRLFFNPAWLCRSYIRMQTRWATWFTPTTAFALCAMCQNPESELWRIRS